MPCPINMLVWEEVLFPFIPAMDANYGLLGVRPSQEIGSGCNPMHRGQQFQAIRCFVTFNQAHYTIDPS